MLVHLSVGLSHPPPTASRGHRAALPHVTGRVGCGDVSVRHVGQLNPAISTSVRARTAAASSSLRPSALRSRVAAAAAAAAEQWPKACCVEIAYVEGK